MEKIKIDLKILPFQNVMSILMKIPNEDLVHMRKSCKFYDNLVEECKEKFSSRAGLGFRLTDIYYIDGSVEPNVPPAIRICFNGNRSLLLPIPFEPYMMRSLSGISITEICLSFSPYMRLHGQWTSEIIKWMNPSCDCIRLTNAPAETVLELTDVVTIRKSVKLFTHLFENREALNYLELLRSAENSSKFFISLHNLNNQKGIFYTIMPFEEIEFYRTSHEDFRNMIWDMHRNDEEFHLKRITTNFHSQFLYDAEPMPPNTIVWDLRNVPMQYRAVGSPRYIRKLEVLSKDAFIVDGKTTAEGTILIVDRNPRDWLEAMEEMLCISVAEPFRRMYIRGSFEEQLEIIRQAFMRKRYESIWRNRAAGEFAVS